LKTALVHDWLTGMRGGEKVLSAIAGIFPRAPIYTLFCDDEKISERLKKHEINTSYLQGIPGRAKYYRYFLPFFPHAMGRFDFKEHDLIVSTSHCVGKGAIGGPETLHICYCFSPMRYVWDRFDDYFPEDKMSPIKYKIIKSVSKRLREWDRTNADRVDLFIADSNFVKDRIEKYYNRPAKVIFPPANTDYYTPGKSSDEGYYLMAGAMVPYKKGDIVIEAFNNLDRKLVVTGDGSEFTRFVNIASGNIKFTGWIDDETLRDHYRGCRALIFPGVEDFGIVPVEAQACGKPIIAFGEGGVLDTVKGQFIDEIDRFDSGNTGLFFNKQTPEAVRDAVRIFEKLEFDSEIIRDNSLRFSDKRFYDEINEFFTEAIGIFRKQGKIRIEERLIN